MNTETFACPVCGQYTDVEKLEQAGIIPEELVLLRQYIKEKILGKILRVAEIVYQRMDPSSTSIELSVTQSLESMSNSLTEKLEQNNQVLSSISEKIVGPGMGDVREFIITKELRHGFPDDYFDDRQAEKHGTDIIATVFEKKTETGKISISSKDTGSWSSTYIDQLLKNMNHDDAKIGLLIGKKLPKSAKPTGEVYYRDGKMYFVVHQKYALACYAGLRQVVIHMHKTQLHIKNKENELMQIEKISEALVKWISGSEYQEIIIMLDNIGEASDNTRENLLQLQDQVANKIKNTCEIQTKIKQQVLNAQTRLDELKKMLTDSESEEKKND